MKNQILLLLVMVAQVGLGRFCASAHPGSGIVVDPRGQLFFVHTGVGVGKIDTQGKLTYVHRSRGGHWMCLDTAGSFSGAQPRHFERITPAGVKPAIIFADGGSPIAVLPDGNLYYVSNDEKMTPGGLQITRNSPGGEISVFPPDGALYIASPSAVLKLEMDGTSTTLVHPIRLADCDVDYPDGNTNNALPFLRGLAVDEHGTVFAAGTGCHCVVKITPHGKAETILKAARPWSPTGVAVHRGELYVLEYANANAGSNEGWRPRVRKLARDGKITTLVTVPR